MRYELNIDEIGFRNVDWFGIFRKEISETISMTQGYKDSEDCIIKCSYGNYTRDITISKTDYIDFDTDETVYAMCVNGPGIKLYDESIYNFEFEFNSVEFLNHMVQQDIVYKTLQSVKNVVNFKREQYKILMSQYGADFFVQPIVLENNKLLIKQSTEFWLQGRKIRVILTPDVTKLNSLEVHDWPVSIELISVKFETTVQWILDNLEKILSKFEEFEEGFKEIVEEEIEEIRDVKTAYLRKKMNFIENYKESDHVPQ